MKQYKYIVYLALALVAISCRDTTTKNYFKQSPQEVSVSIFAGFSGTVEKWTFYDKDLTNSVIPVGTNVYGLSQMNMSNLVSMINMLPLRSDIAKEKRGADFSEASFRCKYKQTEMVLFYDYYDGDVPAGKYRNSSELMHTITQPSGY